MVWTEYAQNSLHHYATGLTMFQCVQGYQPPLCPWDTVPTDVLLIDDWFTRAERVWEDSQSRPTNSSNSPHYHVGDRVWLSTQDLLLLPCKKLINTVFLLVSFLLHGDFSRLLVAYHLWHFSTAVI